MSKKLNVLALASWFPNEDDVQRGIFVKHQLEAIAEDHDVTLITLRPAANASTIVNTENGVIHHRHTYVRNQYPIKALSWYVAWMAIINKLKPGQFDVLHLHVIYPMGIVALQCKKHLDIPLITSEHWSGYLKNNWGGLVRKYFTKKVVAKSQQVVVQSNFLQNAMLKRGLHANYQLVPNLLRFDTEGPSSPRNNKSIVFLNVADHIDSTKNISGLLRSFSEIRKTAPDVEFWQIGAGPDTKRLHKLAKQLGVYDHVRWIGRVAQNEVIAYIKACNFGVINSRIETFSIVAFEFLAAKKPVVLTACGGPEEYLPSNFGRLIEVDNDTQLSKAIVELASTFEQYNLEEESKTVLQSFSPRQFRDNINLIYTSI